MPKADKMSRGGTTKTRYLDKLKKIITDSEYTSTLKTTNRTFLFLKETAAPSKANANIDPKVMIDSFKGIEYFLIK
jgi:hypothetical protein